MLWYAGFYKEPNFKILSSCLTCGLNPINDVVWLFPCCVWDDVFLFVECCLENQCVLFVLTFVFIAFNFSCNDFALLLFVCYCAVFCLFCLEKHRVLFFCCLRFRSWLKLDVQSRLEQLQISEPAIAQGNSFNLLPLGPAYSSFSYCPFWDQEAPPNSAEAAVTLIPTFKRFWGFPETVLRILIMHQENCSKRDSQDTRWNEDMTGAWQDRAGPKWSKLNSRSNWILNYYCLMQQPVPIPSRNLDSGTWPEVVSTPTLFPTWITPAFRTWFWTWTPSLGLNLGTWA